eukprot:5920603-Pleurochrysis_carterae.AAC.1
MAVAVHRTGVSHRERARARGLGAPTEWLQVGGAQARSAMRATGIPEPGDRSTSAPQVRMRCECNLGNYA